MKEEYYVHDRCLCCGFVYGCYCHEYPHEDNPACPGNLAHVEAWVRSEAGQQALRDAAEKAKEVSEKFRKASIPTEKSLHRRVTI